MSHFPLFIHSAHTLPPQANWAKFPRWQGHRGEARKVLQEVTATPTRAGHCHTALAATIKCERGARTPTVLSGQPLINPLLPGQGGKLRGSRLAYSGPW